MFPENELARILNGAAPAQAPSPIEHWVYGVSGVQLEEFRDARGLRCIAFKMNHPSGHTYVFPIPLVDVEKLTGAIRLTAAKMRGEDDCNPED